MVAGGPALKDWTKSLDIDLENRSELIEFARLYGLRNTQFAHGQREATMQEALDAKRVLHALRTMLHEEFGRRYGVTLESLQTRSLQARSMMLDRTEIERVLAMTDDAKAILNDARGRVRALIDQHRPMYPAALRDAIGQLDPTARRSADQAFEDALRADFELLKRMWATASDGDRILGEVVDEIEEREARRRS